LTLSSNEWTWLRLKEFLIENNKDIADIKTYSINELFVLDPVSDSFFWKKKIRAFFKTVILASELSALGKITHCFLRREYQMRGVQHVYSKLWEKDAPILVQMTIMIKSITFTYIQLVVYLILKLNQSFTN
jgi:hypothetical protein